MEKKTVGLVRFLDKRENIRLALQLCRGLKDLRPHHRVLLKPNLVMWDPVYPFPKYGVLTTTLVVEEIVKTLKEEGCSHISIGEGTVEDPEVPGITGAAFAGLGYHELQKKYGLHLVDFNSGPHVGLEMDGFTLQVSRHVLEADFIINLPVLKTHNSTRVSLGFKNLKGCLDLKSRMFCHGKTHSLDGFIRRLGEAIKPQLTVIDGIYALERGPAVIGKAYRSDVLVASRDMFAADLVGARILGFEAADIPHLKEYAERQGLPLDGSNIEILGEKVEEVALPLEWDWKWKDDDSGPAAFERLGITGIYYPKYDTSLCSGCTFLNNYMLILLMGAYRGKPFPGLEFLGGKNALSRGGFSKTFLFGKCAIKENRGNAAIQEAVPIRGCPPRAEGIVRVLQEHGIPADPQAYAHYRAGLAQRYKDDPRFAETHYGVRLE